MAEGISRLWRGWELDCRGVWWEPKKQSEWWPLSWATETCSTLGWEALDIGFSAWETIGCWSKGAGGESQSAVTPSGNSGIEGRLHGPQHLWWNECFSLHEGFLWLPLVLLWLGLPSMVAKDQGCWNLVRLYQPSQSPWTKRTLFWIAQLLEGLATSLHTVLPQENWH